MESNLFRSPKGVCRPNPALCKQRAGLDSKDFFLRQKKRISATFLLDSVNSVPLWFNLGSASAGSGEFLPVYEGG